jgi:periplasmic protein TonB
VRAGDHKDLAINSFCEMLEDSRKRLPVVALTALVVWLGLLTAVGLLLQRSQVIRVSDSPIAVGLIDLPVEGLSGGGGSSAGESSKPQPRPAEATRPRKAARHRNTLPPREAVPSRPRQHKIDLASAAVAAPPMKNINEPNGPPLVEAKPQTDSSGLAAPTKSTSALGATMGNGGGLGSGHGTGAGSGSGSGAGGGFGTGDRGPNAIYAPVPSIPDDLRDEVMQATAVARFHVRRDGGSTVTLIVSTEFSTLDDSILETLRRWRFRPAFRNGEAIDADADVRLLITVQ